MGFIKGLHATTRVAAAVGLISVFGVVSTVQAAETIKLTAIDGYPPKSLWVKEFIEFFIPTVDKALAKTGNYKIKWNQA